MVNINEVICPHCGGDLKYYNTIQRIIKTKGGKNSWIEIRRLVCKKCGSIHRELPTCLLPYKHYDTEIIEGVVNGEITQYDLDYEDYPCELTIKKWRESQKIHLLLRNRKLFFEGRKCHMKKIKETKSCPDCGGTSMFLNYVERTVRSENGKVDKIKVKRFKCSECGKIRRELPKFLMPYKQFRTDIIEGFVNESLTAEDGGYEDFPCEQTVKHWKKEFSK